jgi:tRNA nucleotidyltransferase (CCA-adding enzyme)
VNAYLVGGCVRDRLLGLPVRDRDWVVVGASAGQLLGRGFQPVGKGFPVFLHPETREEYALADDLEQDLCRRDFTINALAEDETGRLFDPTGGRADLEARIIRALPGSLADDPVRCLRAARLVARLDGFTIAAETRVEITRLGLGGALDAVPPERLWQELDKALAADRPSRFFLALRDLGILGAVLPELDRLFGVPQRAEFHPEIDTGVHAMMVVDMAAGLTPDRATRFAALVHDLGKGLTPAELLPRHAGHEDAGARLVAPMVRRLAGPNQYADLGTMAARWHGIAHKVGELRPGSMVRLLEGIDAFHRPERLEALLVVAEADRRGRLGHGDHAYPQATAWRQALAAAATVCARDLVAAGHAPGPALAAVLFQKRAEAIRAHGCCHQGEEPSP